MSGTSESAAMDTAIAIVGMGCRFPGAADPRAFWKNLVDGVESIEDLSEEELLAAGVDPALVNNPAYVRRAAALEGMDRWDAGFFGFSPKEAAIMDPQQRHFLELSWEALEDAGYAPGTFEGPVGVFAGCGPSTYMMFQILGDPSVLRDSGFFLVRHIGNDKDFIATRVSYHFNLTGPGVGVQTACSTSLTAVHLAVQSLLSHECDMALAGGVTITFPHRLGYLFEEGEILAPDGHCRAFDADSAGTVLGDGGGAVVLRRLQDAIDDGDTIHAVIRGSAMNNDGSGKVGYFAPSVEGQARVIAEALAVADVEPDTIGLIEAHGTGTKVGDPIEITALTQAFRAGTERVGYCGLGSVKANIGHLDTAAGVAALMKATLAVKHGIIPPTPHFRTPNPELQLETSPFRIYSRQQKWENKGGPRRAGVSSLGVGGTNVHVILEEAPEVVSGPDARAVHLFVLSGRSRGVLERGSSRLVDHLETNTDQALADVAWTLQAGRALFRERRILVGGSREEVIDALVTGDPTVIEDYSADDRKRNVAFLFAGGGAQYGGMSSGLHASENVFREEMDRGLAHLEGPLRESVKALLEIDGQGPLPEEDREKPSIALPALFLVQHALARLWMSWGASPSAMIGHSMGEYTAACLASVLTMEEALELVVLRGELFETVSGGGMLGIPLSEEELRPLLGDELSLAAVNGPELCVASGPREAIDALEALLAAREVDARRIHIDVAAHSSMLEPILAPFRERLRKATLQVPQLPFTSNLTGTWITAEEATDPEYWVRQLRETVRFSEGLKELLADTDRVLLEVGPGRTLATLARLHPDRDPAQEVFTSLRHPEETVDDEVFLLRVLGRLWQRGVEIDWAGVHGGARRLRVPLPTYAFEWERHLIEPVYRLDAQAAPHLIPGAGHQAGEQAGGAETGAGGASEADAAAAGSDDPAGWLHEVRWAERALEPADVDALDGDGSAGGDMLLFASDDSANALGTGLASLLPKGARLHLARPGNGFTKLEDGFRLRFGSEDDVEQLLDAVGAGDPDARPLSRIVYAGALDLPDDLPATEERAFYALFAIGRALGRRMDGEEVELVVLTRGAQHTANDPEGQPGGSLVAGPIRVLPAETPGLSTRWIDLPAEGGPAGDFSASLSREISEGGEDQIVALRDTGRFVPRYERVARHESAGSAIALAHGGLSKGAVCVITGGFGGIGLELARHLADHSEARLALLGRTSLPPRAEWDRVEERGEDPRVIRAIGVIRDLESRGARVLPLAVDVADEDALAGARDRIRSELGEVDVLFHAAGVLEDSLTLLKSRESADRVLAPKVRGTLALDRVFRDPEPARFVLFSSVSAEAGLPGQVDYTSANAFLDAFARSRARRSPSSPTVSIGWSAWAETGMAVDQVHGLVSWPPLSGPVWTSATDPAFDAVDRSGGRLRTRLRKGRLWMLDEHRTRDGTPLLPGAGYLELLKGAATELGLEGSMHLSEVFFLAPFVVEEGDTREIEFRLPTAGASPEGSTGSDNTGGAFSILGRGRPDEAWVEHVRGEMRVASTAAPSPVDLVAIQARTTPMAAGEWISRQDLDLGPRWDNMAGMSEGRDEILITMELPSELSGDVELHALHAALLDNATAVAGPLLPGFGEEGSVYVPASYGSFTMHRPLPQRFFSHVRRAQEADGHSDDLAVLDVTLIDGAGVVLVEAEQFMMVRVRSEEISRSQAEARDAREARAHAAGLAAEKGVPTEVGLAILDLLLDMANPPDHVLISAEPIASRLKDMREAALSSGGRAGKAGGRKSAPPPPAIDVSPVEEALLALGSVLEAAVTAHEDRPGEIRLVAHVALDPKQFATVSELRRALRAELPPELVPQNFVQLDQLPKDARGKIARDELRDPFAPVDDHVEPETPTQIKIAGIWRDLLGANRIGIHDNFLDVGGHSLLAMRAILRMEKETGVRVGPIEINMFTLDQIATGIDAQSRGADGTSAEGPPAEGSDSPTTASSAGAESAAEVAGACLAPDWPAEEEQSGADPALPSHMGDRAGPEDKGRGKERKGLLSAVRRFIPGA